MNGGSFMGEDVYGSFASMDADLLHLPDNSGNSGMSLVPVYRQVLAAHVSYTVTQDRHGGTPRH